MQDYLKGPLFELSGNSRQVQVNISIRFSEIPVYDQPNLRSQRNPTTVFAQI